MNFVCKIRRMSVGNLHDATGENTLYKGVPREFQENWSKGNLRVQLDKGDSKKIKDYFKEVSKVFKENIKEI